MKSVLMIEDFPVLHKIYGDYLKRHGYQVVVVADAEKALQILEERQFDFILLDLLLPKVNGIEFLEQFSDRPKKTRIIVLSDFNEENTLLRAKELGVDKFLIKAENTPSELAAKLKEFEQPQT